MCVTLIFLIVTIGPKKHEETAVKSKRSFSLSILATCHPIHLARQHNWVFRIQRPDWLIINSRCFWKESRSSASGNHNQCSLMSCGLNQLSWLKWELITVNEFVLQEQFGSPVTIVGGFLTESRCEQMSLIDSIQFTEQNIVGASLRYRKPLVEFTRGYGVLLHFTIQKC